MTDELNDWPHLTKPGLKHEVLIRSLQTLQIDMREVAIDLKHLYPNVSAGDQLNGAANIISEWIDNIQKGTVK